jgi:hypothetical protein
MQVPNANTPAIFDYLWLYTLLRRYLPKDIVYQIIGTHKYRNIFFSPSWNTYVQVKFYHWFDEEEVKRYHYWKKFIKCS